MLQRRLKFDPVSEARYNWVVNFESLNFMKKKNITIDDLATMVQNGFSESRKYMDSRFSEMEERLMEIFGLSVAEKLKLIPFFNRFI